MIGIQPVDLREIDKVASNVYEAIIISAKRARQINDERKIEYNALVSSVPSSTATDDDGEDFDNPQQMKISLEFEKRLKPHSEALKELLNKDFEFEYKNKI
jgi:pyruvate/2-oxoglutarate dehydrogenase complex dihydrolipoamide acyltransferase (E2) component